MVKLLLALLLTTGAARAQRERVHDVKHWAYQLQGVPNPSAAIDLLVIDAADNGTFISRERVQALKRRPGRADRIVLAYLSVGEAETYRYYWRPEWKRSPPAFLARENREWRDNFKVRYWQGEWQQILVGYEDRILDAGFDGAYLDVVDAFEYFAPDGPQPERPTAPEEMARLVEKLAAHARVERKTPGFLLVPQNGVSLPARVSPEVATSYLTAIDAVGVEDLFFYGNRRENNDLDIQKETLTELERFQQARKPVLSVEYVTEPSKVRHYARLARARGFVPCAARRSLDRLLELAD
jgi:cysteinyl-tRNA synthetase